MCLNVLEYSETPSFARGFEKLLLAFTHPYYLFKALYWIYWGVTG